MSYLPDVHRLLPHSHDAEQGVLGSIILSPDEVMGDLSDSIQLEHFHHPANRTIYSIILECWQNKIPIGLTPLTQILKDKNLLDQVGGAEYITGLYTFVPTSTNVDFYIDVLERKRQLREVITICTEYAARSYNEQGDSETLVFEVQQKISSIGKLAEKETKESLLVGYINELEERQKDIDSRRIIPTRFCEIDSRSGGVYRKNMGVISAKPGIGKSAFGATLMLHACLDQDYSGLIISVEMSYQEIMDRLVSSLTRIPHETIQRKKLSQKELLKTMNALDRIAKSKLEIVANPRIGIEGIKSAFRKRRPDIGFVDFIQKIKTPEAKEAANREQQLSYISGEFARLASEINGYILVGSQENAQEGTKHCATIIEDAHDWFRLIPKKEDRAMRFLECAKRRSGESGWIAKLTFIQNIVRFENHSSVPE